MHEDLFVDADYPNRGHRKNILNPGYREVGIGTASGQYQNYTETYMITCDFGSARNYSESFVLGVVYEDLNNNSFYDAGEGIKNAEITIDSSAGPSVLTATAGGYGIPLADGPYSIKAVMPDGESIEKSFTIAGENVKVDFRLSGSVPAESSSDGGCFIQSASVR